MAKDIDVGNDQTIVANNINIIENEYKGLPLPLKTAKILNELRIVPRIFLIVYTVVFYQVVQWALDQEELTTPETGLVGVIAGMASIMFSAYTMTSKNNKK